MSKYKGETNRKYVNGIRCPYPCAECPASVNDFCRTCGYIDLESGEHEYSCDEVLDLLAKTKNPEKM